MTETNSGPRRVGVGMMLACWVVMLALALWWFRGVESRRENPNFALGAGVALGEPVTLERNVSGHYVAPGEINGTAVTFLIDTGATYISMSQSLANELSLEPGAAVIFTTANGQVRGNLTTLEHVSLGGLRAEQVAGSIHKGIDDAIVLMGMSFLGRFDIQIRGNEMVVSPPAT